MSKRPTIRQTLLAGWLLLVFTFSIMPRMALHELLANHRDARHKPGDPATTQINSAGFNCNCDSLVVESPFVENEGVREFFLPFSWSTISTVAAPGFYSRPVLYHELRGPPLSGLFRARA